MGVVVLYARLILVSLVAILFVPVLHRVLHKVHLEPEAHDEDLS